MLLNIPRIAPICRRIVGNNCIFQSRTRTAPPKRPTLKAGAIVSKRRVGDGGWIGAIVEHYRPTQRVGICSFVARKGTVGHRESGAVSHPKATALNRGRIVVNGGISDGHVTVSYPHPAAKGVSFGVFNDRIIGNGAIFNNHLIGVINKQEQPPALSCPCIPVKLAVAYGNRTAH